MGQSIQTSRRRILETSTLSIIAGEISNPNLYAQALSARAMTLLGGFTWLKHASFYVQDGERFLYFDPARLTSFPHPADWIFVSHSHSDHCDPSSVRPILKAETRILTDPESANALRSLTSNIIAIPPGKVLAMNGLIIQTVPAYNINKPNHPKSKNWLGFIVTLTDGRRVYHAGDTDIIPEMANFEADVAMLPVSGTYVMDYREAADAARIIRPTVAVPMHYGSGVGTVQDGIRFQQELAGEIEVMVFETGQTIPPAVTAASCWQVK